MNQFPAVCNYAQPDIFIPYEWLDFSQAQLRSWMEEGILWESSSPLEPSLFWECLHISCKSLLCFPMPCETGHQVTLDKKVPRSACDITQFIPALSRSSLSICTLTLPECSSSDHLGQPHRRATTVNRTNNENSSKKAERGLQMRRKLMTNKQQRWF